MPIFSTCIVENSVEDAQKLYDYCKINEYVSPSKPIMYTSMAYKFITDNKIQIVFINPEMPLISGMDLAKKLDYEKTFIIIVSDKPEFAAEAFQINAFDFLLKPLTYEKVSKSIKKIAKLFDKGEVNPIIVFEGNDMMFAIDCNSVIYIKVTSIKICFYFTNRPTLSVNNRCKTQQNKIPEYLFIRINEKSYVNIKYITGIFWRKVIINNHLAYDKSLPEILSLTYPLRPKRDELRQKLSNL